MKNSEIHKNKPNAVIRDYLSLSLVKIFELECLNRREIVNYSNDAMAWAIKDCENEIVFHHRRLELLKEKQAVITLIKMNGWQDFDVSDWTENDTGHKLHMTFIGTQEEYDNLMLELKTT